jgi:hypothetical protein
LSCTLTNRPCDREGCALTLQVVLLTGTYLDGSGTPACGTVTFVPSVPLTDPADFEIVLQVPVTVMVNSAGQFSVSLYATDNADLQPAGWTWQVTENFAGLLTATWSFFLPRADGSVQDISSLAPVAEAVPAVAYLPESGGTMSGTLTLDGSPPLRLPSGTSTYVLTSDGSGNITLQPPEGGGLADLDGGSAAGGLAAVSVIDGGDA